MLILLFFSLPYHHPPVFFIIHNPTIPPLILRGGEGGVMPASHAMSMACTGMLQGELGKILTFQHMDIFSDSLRLCLKNFNTLLVQFDKRACTDTSDNNRINFLIIQCFDRVAGTMCMMLIVVVDRCHIVAISLNNNECRGRAEMSIHLTVHTFSL